MPSKHLIMGTAGHVDHGKTSLIKALTGFDCDTHKQEKERGITINLGFWHLDLPGGNSLGIIDVPGHADFIKTMVSGAAGFDFVLLVIAADEGIMPQTREHLDIMKTLGIRQGLIALNKVDAVENELIQLALEEVKDFTAGSFLSQAPVLPVSSLTGEGIADLIKELNEISDKIPPRDSSGIFRLYIDRIFTQPGFGTIVNGSVLSGYVSRDDPVHLLPGNSILKIRRMERHGSQVDRVEAGDRASFNITGLKQKEFRKGMLLVSKPIQATTLIDVKLTLFEDAVELKLWTQAIFLSNTIRQICRLHLLDRDRLEPGQAGLAQIYLPDPAVIMMGDRFILRNSSGNKTLGGGSIIDPYPLHHRRRRENQIEMVEKISTGKLTDLVVAEVRKSPRPLGYRDIAGALNLEPDELIDTIFHELPDEIRFIQGEDDILLLEKKKYTDIRNRLLNNLSDFHRKNPFSTKGRTVNELAGIFGNDQHENNKLALRMILEELGSENRLSKDGKTWKLSEHKVEIGAEIEKIVLQVMDRIDRSEQHYLEIDKLYEHFSRSDISKTRIQQVIDYMLENKQVINIRKLLFKSEYVEQVRQKLISFLDANSTGISVAEYRDLLKTNRFTAIALLEFFDDKGITIRKNNKRIFTNRFLSEHRDR